VTYYTNMQLKSPLFQIHLMPMRKRNTGQQKKKGSEESPTLFGTAQENCHPVRADGHAWSSLCVPTRRCSHLQTTPQMTRPQQLVPNFWCMTMAESYPDHLPTPQPGEGEYKEQEDDDDTGMRSRETNGFNDGYALSQAWMT